jgi:hypothetical protein
MRHRCLAVSIEYVRGGRQRCYAIERSADSDGGVLISAPELAYFQKICLQGKLVYIFIICLLMSLDNH